MDSDRDPRRPGDPEPGSPAEPASRPREGKGGRKAFLLRLSPELHDELRGWAEAELRSLNAHIEYLLRQALRRRRGGAPGED